MKALWVLLALLWLAGPVGADQASGTVVVGGRALKLTSGYASLTRSGFLQIYLLPRPLKGDPVNDIKPGEAYAVVSMWFSAADKLTPAGLKDCSFFLYGFPVPDPSGAETGNYHVPSPRFSVFRVSPSRVKLTYRSTAPLPSTRSEAGAAQWQFSVDLPLVGK